jgi:hypothetical protein
MQDDLELRVRKPVGAVLSVRVPKELAIAADEFARDHSVSISEVVRAAVEGYLANPPVRERMSVYASTFEAGLVLNSPEAGFPQPTAGRALTQTRRFEPER